MSDPSGYYSFLVAIGRFHPSRWNHKFGRESTKQTGIYDAYHLLIIYV